MLLAVDYSSLLYRAFYSMPEHLPAHAVHGFLNMLARAITDRRPTEVAVAVDDDWRPAFRTEAIPSYKAARVADEGEEEDPVAPQEELGRLVLAAFGIAVVGAADYEADDVIATLAARARGAVEILSGDRDLFALVRDPDVLVLYPRRGTADLTVIDEAAIEERYGIPGRAYGDFALLRGDPSDGLPGVRGIGDKTAAALLREHGSVDAILACRDLPPAVARKLDAGREYLERARRVVPPVVDVPLPQVDLALPADAADAATLGALAQEYELGGALARLGRAVAGARSA